MHGEPGLGAVARATTGREAVEGCPRQPWACALPASTFRLGYRESACGTSRGRWSSSCRRGDDAHRPLQRGRLRRERRAACSIRQRPRTCCARAAVPRSIPRWRRFRLRPAARRAGRAPHAARARGAPAGGAEPPRGQRSPAPQREYREAPRRPDAAKSRRQATRPAWGGTAQASSRSTGPSSRRWRKLAQSARS